MIRMPRLDPDATDRYLERIGLDPADVHASEPDYALLARLQRAHVRSVPFENLAIVGDPEADEPGEGVSLDLDAIYEKLVVAGRGGYCFELNGLFTTLLETLGFEVARAAAMVLSSDGTAETPANHHSVCVSLDGTYVADPGLGRPQMERPVPLAGDPTDPDPAGVQWRVVESGRPRYDRAVQVRTPDADWASRYVFDPTPRPLQYFAATNDYFTRAPESIWTQLLIVRRKTADGWVELDEGRLRRHVDGAVSDRAVPPEDLPDVLDQEFGIDWEA